MAAATLFGSKFSKKEAANLRTRTIHSQICTCEPEQKRAPSPPRVPVLQQQPASFLHLHQTRASFHRESFTQPPLE